MNNIKRARYLGIAAICLAIAWFIWGIGIAKATDRNDPDVEVDTRVHVGGDEIVVEGDELNIEGDSIDVAPVLSTNISRERSAPNIYNLAGQAERDCGIVFGLSGSNTTGGWAFGIPIPRGWTPTCDLWKAAREAKENGHGWTSYFFMCQIKTIRKVWTEEGCAEIRVKAMDELNLLQPPFEPIATPTVNAAVSDMVAQVAADDYQRDQELENEQRELVEYRQVQQQHLIESLQDETEAQRIREAELAAEVERLRIEAAEREAERLASRAKLAEGLAAYKVKEK